MWVSFCGFTSLIFPPSFNFLFLLSAAAAAALGAACCCLPAC